MPFSNHHGTFQGKKRASAVICDSRFSIKIAEGSLYQRGGIRAALDSEEVLVETSQGAPHPEYPRGVLWVAQAHACLFMEASSFKSSAG